MFTSSKCRVCGVTVATAVFLTLAGEPNSASAVAKVALIRACQVRAETSPYVVAAGSETSPFGHQGHTEVGLHVIRINSASIMVTGGPSSQFTPPTIPGTQINWIDSS